MAPDQDAAFAEVKNLQSKCPHCKKICSLDKIVKNFKHMEYIQELEKCMPDQNIFKKFLSTELRIGLLPQDASEAFFKFIFFD